jgi:hypothetical protein
MATAAAQSANPEPLVKTEQAVWVPLAEVMAALPAALAGIQTVAPDLIMQTTEINVRLQAATVVLEIQPV